MTTRAKGESTTLARLGRPASGWANTPIVKGSTYLFDSIEHWRGTREHREKERVLSYGARGNETVYALEDAITELEKGFRTKLFPTGLAAIATVLLAYLQSGDHLLISEGVYEPVRRLCRTQLAKYGVDVSFFNPFDNVWQSSLRERTRMVYVESPGSILYDMLDIPAMATACRAKNILLCADNTWGSCLSYRPLELGCDISIVAATKYLGGHSDVMMGSATATESAFAALENASVSLGQTAAAEDAFLVLRGLRTLNLRLRRHSQSALQIASWLERQKAVHAVYHPALPGNPSHALWQRDAHGSNGLLTIEFDPELPEASIEQALNRLQLFGIGSSWGGYESLVLPADPARTRLREHPSPGYLARLHIGLEEPADLLDDLNRMVESLTRSN